MYGHDRLWGAQHSTCSGCILETGVIRPDFCGALVLSDAPITAITANRMAFLNTAFYRDTPGKPAGAVPLWQFGR